MVSPSISPLPPLPIDLPLEEIAAFCRKWKITEMSVFGSVLRDDFRPDSDLDFMAVFAQDSPRQTLWDMVRVERELGELVGRHVDLVERECVEDSPNWIRRKHILESARTFYIG